MGRFAGGVGGFRGAGGSKISCLASVGKVMGDGAVGICGLAPACAGLASSPRGEAGSPRFGEVEAGLSRSGLATGHS